MVRPHLHALKRDDESKKSRHALAHPVAVNGRKGGWKKVISRPHTGTPIHAGGKAEHAQIDCGAAAGQDAKPDGVQRDDAGKRQQRLRATDPLAECAALDPGEEPIDVGPKISRIANGK
jgi:hypothetical protein